jgi:DHA3 family macrolide efflux protein-like MFS transporter
MSIRNTAREMRTFIFIWSGQLISLIGSGLTGFALGVWVYQRTGSATKFALISLATTLPAIIILPLAGAFVDRLDRRLVMILSDFGASLSTVAVAVLLFTERLQIWHIYLATATQSIFSAFQWPAYTASLTLLIPKRHFGRASGMLQLSEAAAQIAAPLLAGLLLGVLHLWGILLVDYATFLCAVLVLLLVRIPRPPASQQGETRKDSLLRDVTFGWFYITTRPGLLSLLLFFAVTNFLTGMVLVLGSPLILSFASVQVLGTILSIAGCGMFVGSLAMSTWGGPKRRIKGVLGFELLTGLCIIVAGLRPSATLIAISTFIYSCSLPIVLSCSQALWQSKVAPEVQGRVFGVRRVMAWSTLPLAYLVAGPLADRVFTPLLATGGLLVNSLGRVIGVGPGRGIGLLFMLLGLLVVMTSVAGYLYPRLRFLEDELPDTVVDQVDIAH